MKVLKHYPAMFGIAAMLALLAFYGVYSAEAHPSCHSHNGVTHCHD